MATVVIKDGEVVARSCNMCGELIRHPWDNETTCNDCLNQQFQMYHDGSGWWIVVPYNHTGAVSGAVIVSALLWFAGVELSY